MFIYILSGALNIFLPMFKMFNPGVKTRRMAYLLREGIYPEW